MLGGEDLEEIKTKTEALAQASMKIGEMLYQAQQADGGDADGGPSEDGPSDGGDDVVDADFEEVDDDEKKSA